MTNRLRVIVADDERPARSYLVAMLQTFEEIELLGEATDGAAAIELIERTQPDLALLDLQMPEVDGLNVVRLVKPALLPLVAFVTAYDEYAVRAFELNAIDYLLKPVERTRLAETLRRTQDRLEAATMPAIAPATHIHPRPSKLTETKPSETHPSEAHASEAQSSEMSGARRKEAMRLHAALDAYERDASPPHKYLERLPVRRSQGEIVLLPVRSIASVIADGELLHITVTGGGRYTINYRLKDLEARLDPTRFVRLSRGTLANREMIARVHTLPGGTYLVTLTDNQQLSASRIRSRVLREELLKL